MKQKKVQFSNVGLKIMQLFAAFPNATIVSKALKKDA